MSTKTGLSERAGWAAGQPISRLMHLALARPELISLAAGFVDQQSLPADPVREAVEALLAEPARARAALQYGTTPGFPPLREALLAHALAADGLAANEAHASVEQMVLTAGSNQLLHLVCEALCDPGDIVLCGSPSYFVFLGMLGNLGVRAIGVASDEEGIVPRALEDELARRKLNGQLGRIKAIYVTSYFDNPRSITLAAERRGAIVEIAKRWSTQGQIYVIEDIAYRELRYAGDDLPTLRSFDADGTTVVLAGTFSKSFSPGLRVGWGLLPVELVDPVCDLKGNMDFGSPNFNQHLVAEVLSRGLFEPHVERLRATYRVKLAAMLEAAGKFLGPIPGVRWISPSGGLYVWVELPETVDTGIEGSLFNSAVNQGVLYVPGNYCYPDEGEPVRRNTIRLSFGVQSPENIRRGMESLARAIQQELQATK